MSEWGHGCRNGGRGALAPLNFDSLRFPIKFLAKKCFLNFVWVNLDLTNVGLPCKIHYWTPWKKSFRRPCLEMQHKRNDSEN